jgi:diaminopimelate decarboxylase
MDTNIAPSLDRWNDPVDIRRASRCVQLALESGLLSEATPALIFHDLDRMQARIAELQQVFPANTLHTVAIKANPLQAVLRNAVETGAGLEAASQEEVWLAQAAGCPPERIVFDSPAKTPGELNAAIAEGLCINVDNEWELARLNSLLQEHPTGPPARIGLRINPLVGKGSIGITSVGSRGSKFGIPIDNRAAILDLYRRYSWLNGIHVHVGSQGSPLEHLVQAVKVAFEYVDLINQQAHRKQITFVDIGGGLPARYVPSHVPPTPRDYARALAAEVPKLSSFDGLLITEFGRAIQASCGWAVSRVEYLKETGGRKMAVLHLGADFLMRTVYQPEHWPHRFVVLTPAGEIKDTPLEPLDIGGPLCFAGDIIGTQVQLPRIDEGDFVMICDTGAYTLSLWSRHCNRAMPAVLGVRGDETIRLELLKAREREHEIVRLWSAPESPNE